MLKKDCNVNLVFVEQFLDNQLSLQESAEMSVHIKDCERCKKHYDSIKSLKMTLHSVKEHEQLSPIELIGFEKFIDDSNSKKSFLEMLITAYRYTTNHAFVVTSASAAVTVIIFAFVFNIIDIDSDNPIIMNELLSMHDLSNLPDDFDEKDMDNKVAQKNLSIPAAAKKFAVTRPVIKGRFTHVGSVPTASLKFQDNAKKGTLVVSKNNGEMKKLFKKSDCIKEKKNDCVAKQKKSNGRNLLYWEDKEDSFVFVTDDNEMKSDMIRLISAE